jgi:ABC-type anion transport system duplicated permease subunit
MNKKATDLLDTGLESMVSEFNAESDPKNKIGVLKCVAVVDKMLRDQRKEDSDNLVQKDQMDLERQKLKLEERKYRFDRKQKSIENQLEIEKNQIARLQLKADEEERARASRESKIKIAVDIGLATIAIVPAILNFVGGMLTLKLEYLDNGRSPSTFKDFMHAVKK